MDLRPIVMVGQQGLSEAVLAELESTMTKHELFKIKVRANDREEKQQIVDKILNFSKAALVQVYWWCIGYLPDLLMRTLVLFCLGHKCSYRLNLTIYNDLRQ